MKQLELGSLHLGWLYWDPNPIAFRIPGVDLPVFIYGLFFVAGFILGYFILLPILSLALKQSGVPIAECKKTARELIDKLTWYIVGGTIIGARLGHVLFYDFERYSENPWSILNTREGGLASHGGAIGVILALYLYHRFVLKPYRISFLRLFEMVAIPTALVGCFIRLGNFFNQEIVGTPTSLPWGVIFGHPAEGGSRVPRHPVQLYEAFCYFFIFATLLAIWNYKKNDLKEGLIGGIFLITLFGSRFVLEFFKERQTSVFDFSFLQMGQLLSLPFIVAGICLLFFSLTRKNSSQGCI